MAKSPLIEIDALRHLLRYKEDTGLLFWRKRSASWFNPTGKISAETLSKQWNGKYSDREAFSVVSFQGYKIASILNKKYLAHRVIWAMAHGEWPIEIDHINGDKTDNRLRNLRNVTRMENAKNSRGKKNNTSGYNGVYWINKRRHWIAKITIEWKCWHLGSFDTAEEAYAARVRAERDTDFTSAHGDLSYKNLPTIPT